MLTRATRGKASGKYELPRSHHRPCENLRWGASMQKAKLVRHPHARRRSIALIGALVLAAGIATPSLGAAQAGATTKSAAVIHNTCSRSAIDVPSCGVL